ncbi:SART-1 protein [Penicillium chermesinum]|uniref:SART-1 protein n=1 Tax=Penicillium chermesinum TaxID=63820 RepID=A0A9W9NBZ1_9EURO|nr:SART-1 protein [Penicillium chermesinum]KAJ5217033.1 SART-1 protein [Penicillium chermesinum]KAJ6171357.1 SART-1 protein [Penicillium chermesinum]
MADVADILAANKTRVALGMEPLPVPGATSSRPDAKDDQRTSPASDNDDTDEPRSTIETRQAASHENWKKYHQEATAKIRRDQRHAAIKKAREIADRERQLVGRTLGESEGADLDTDTWLSQLNKRSKKAEKAWARKFAQEQEEMEKAAAAQYTAKDLAGVKVGHDLGDFEGEEEHILTLKDTMVGDEEDDELENTELVDKAKTAERLELKKKKPVYDPTAEYQGILSHYDEEIEGKKRKLFTLDAKGSSAAERSAKKQQISQQLRMGAVSLDFEPEAPSSDYKDISEIKIKKPKKTKNRVLKKRATIDEEDLFPGEAAKGGGAMDIDSASGVPAPAKKPIEQNISFVDDDDLQASLAAQRQAALKKRKKMGVEEIARRIREEQSQTPMEVEDGEENTAESGIILDDTENFVDRLDNLGPEERPKRATSRKPSEARDDEDEDDQTADVDMERSYNDVESGDDSQERVRHGSEQANPKLSVTGLEEEASLDRGLGATLAMLRQRGIVKTPASSDATALTRSRQEFVHKKHLLEEEAERRARQQRERDRNSGRLAGMSAREREEHARRENQQRELQDARQIAEAFNREYKPDVQLKYVDEFGRSMNQKEAFKQLSHQFHGKGSGKMKTEKRLKKIEDEKKREAMSTVDSSQNTGMSSALGDQARKTGQAGVRLG